MSNVLDRNRVETPQPEALTEAAAHAIFTLREHMKPKARAKARARLEAFADRLERDPLTGLPNNVRILRAPPATLAEEAAERAAKARALRFLIGECF